MINYYLELYQRNHFGYMGQNYNTQTIEIQSANNRNHKNWVIRTSSLSLSNVIDVDQCTKPLSTIQCNKTLCQDLLDPYYS